MSAEKENTSRLSTPGTQGKEESFEAVLGKLQRIVERLEQADLDLEDSLQAFEDGIILSRKGQMMLNAAEQRVEILLKDGKLQPLESPQND